MIDVLASDLEKYAETIHEIIESSKKVK